MPRPNFWRKSKDKDKHLAGQNPSSTEGEQRTNLPPRDLAVGLNNVGLVMYERYKHTGALPDLEKAITAYQQALEATPPDSPDHSNYLNNLGNGLYTRYERIGALADLEEAITAYRQVLEEMPSNSPSRPGLLNNLGTGLSARYERIGALADLEEAITAYQQALKATPPDSPDHSGFLSNLGNVLRDRYKRVGELPDLEKAITAYRQALKATPPDSPNRILCLNNLGNGLHTRYERTGALADLEEAITAYRQALEALPSNSPSRAGRLSNLGAGLRDRYERTGALADLEEAITAYRQALEALPSGSPVRIFCLNNLGGGLYARSKRTGALADLEEAIAAYRQALEALPPNSPSRAGLLNNLGGGLRDRYGHTRALADLEEAITAYRQALEATPPDSPSRPSRLNNLGNGLRDRYGHTRALADLEEAITAYRQALEATPPDSPDHSSYLSNLGNVLRDCYKRTGALPDLEKAIAAWEAGWSLSRPRFAALPVVYQLGLQRQDVKIAAALTSAYLERARRHPPGAQLDYCRALEVAEGCKSRLLTQLVGRGSLPLPAGLSPEVAAREQQLLANLTDLDTWELATHDRPDRNWEEARLLNRLQRRQELWHELQRIWDEITMMGTTGEDYVSLRRGDTPTWNDIARMAEVLGSATASISFFMTADQVCLFILRAGWPAPLVVEAPLDDAGWDNLYQRFTREVHRYNSGRPLGETWEEPLRSLLAQAKAHLDGVERLILVPERIGHLLPWSVLAEHAGWRTPLGQTLPLTVLPALGIMPRLRRQPHIRTGPVLVVGNPTGDLPFAEEEANTVASLFGASPLLGAEATKAAVLAYLEQASLIHLATHAFFDPDAPLEAGIILADGNLTAREVLEHHLHADLLVLSACESGLTSSLGGEELAGLSQAFFQAGVRSLLVSLWPVSDPATAALMHAFYAARQRGADKAQALRQAMTKLQQNSRWMHPHYWGAFVLMGDWD